MLKSSRAKVVSLLIASAALTASMHPLLAQGLPQSGPTYDAAQDAFVQLSRHERNQIHLELMATGDFNAMASDQFGHRLYNAVATFQAREGLVPDGILSNETVSRIHEIGGRIVSSWQLGFLDHQTEQASIIIPNSFGLVRTATARGWALENRRHTLSIDFSFFPTGETSLPEIFGRLTAPRAGRQLRLQLLKSDYLAVSGQTDTTINYSRYIPVPGGLAGFTVTWNLSAYPNAGRIAVIMANELYPRRMNVDAGPAAGIAGATSALGAANAMASSGLPSGTLAFSEDVPMSSVPDPVAEASAQSRADEKAERTRAAEQARADERARLAQQQAAADEERQKVEAQAQAARDEAAAKQRKARFEREAAAAKQVIDEASSFVKATPNDPKVLDYVQQIAELNGSLTAGDPDDAEHRTHSLNDALRADPDFSAFRAQRAADKQRQIARDLGDAVHTLASQRQFMIGAVTRDPTSANAVKFLPLIKQAEGAIAAPDLDRVQTLVGQIDAALQSANLSNDFAATQKVEQQQPASSASTAASTGETEEALSSVSPPKPDLKLASTEKNAFLLKGDNQDVVLMFNASPNSPHVVRNLRGDIVFNEGRADVCILGRETDDAALGPLIRETLSAYETAKTVILTSDSCDADRLTSYDVVATRRGTFLRQDAQTALAVIKAIEVDALNSLVTVTEAQGKAATSADAVAATEIATDVDKGSKEGFGLILLLGTVPSICVVASNDSEAHRQLLLGREDKLARDMGAESSLVPTTPDGAFVSAKHGQCGAIYAQASDLKELAGALKRDGVNYRFSSVWIGMDEIKAESDKLQADKDQAEQQLADRQRREADAQRLANLRAADEASKIASRQAASRETYGPRANAAQAKLAQDVKDYTDHPDDDKAAIRLFPVFADHYRDELANRWELMSENAELDDYGTSDFKGRQLETPFTRVTIGLKNRVLGEYKAECFIFGDLEDSEFQMRREAVVLNCDDDAALSRWKIQHGFTSLWNLR